MSRVRDSLLGDWRNKGVALFFAVTIWLVVYQTEKQTTNSFAKVEISPTDPSSTIITSMTYRGGEDPDQRVKFDGNVLLEFSGPRKQVADLAEQLRVTPLKSYLSVERDQTECVLTQEDFGFPREGIQIVDMVPSSIRLTQETIQQRVVANMADHVRVEGVPDDYEVSTSVVRTPKVELSGPASIVPEVVPIVVVKLGHRDDPFDGDVEIELGGVAPERQHLVDLVTATPDRVGVSVRLKPPLESLSVDAVRLTFSVPPFDTPARIRVDELTEGMLPVEFSGPKDQIEQLEARLREPGFSVTVPVPPFELDSGQTAEFTFTEEMLEIFEFPEIQMRPHASRTSPKRPWTYRIIAEKKEEQ